MVMLGLLLGTVGTDINSGVVRYDLGFFELYEGISFIAIAMGLFGVSEVIFSITESVHKLFNQAVTLRSMIPTRAEIRQAVLPVLRGAGIGGLFGSLPGTGPTLDRKSTRLNSSHYCASR